MQLSSKKVFFQNYAFHVSNNVYEPAEDSFLFADHLTVREGDSVLDMGTGCGILGIIVAKKASEVVAVDVNPHSVRCAKQNAEVNHVSDKMFLVQGELFTAIRVGRKFDLIYLTLLIFPSKIWEMTLGLNVPGLAELTADK
jgi:release factor glutamine methyltransferase